MRLVSFKNADGLRIGVITDKGVVDLTLIDPLAPADLGAVVKEGKIDDIAMLMKQAGDEVHYQINHAK